MLACCLILSDDAMRLSIAPSTEKDESPIMTAEALKAAVEKLELKENLDGTLLLKAMQELDEKKEEVLLVEGKPAKDGIDGSLDFRVDVDSTAHFQEEDENSDKKRVDFKESMQVSVVNSGEAIAEVIEAEKGVAGCDLKGAAIEAKDGQPANFRLGKGVRQEGKLLVAEFTGMPVWENSELKVSRVYVLKGDVSMESGNVHFPGTVVVQGDVQEGFTVEADDDIQVVGTVDGSNLKAGKNIEVGGGILGKGTATLHAGKNIALKFCEEAVLEAGGDIEVAKDCTHSTTYCLGKLICGKSLVGGVCIAQKGVEVSVLGAEAGTETKVTIKTDYRTVLLEKKQIDILQLANLMARKYAKSLDKRTLSGHSLTHLEKNINSLKKLIQIFTGNKKRLKDLVAAQADGEVQIEVKKMLHTDVLALAPNCRTQFLESFKGPLRIRDNIKTGQMEMSDNG